MHRSKDADALKDQSSPPKNGFQTNDSINKYQDELEWDEFGTDLYALPEEPRQMLQKNAQPEPTSKAEEDNKIKAFVDASASDWQRQTQDFSGRGGYGRGGGGRGMAGRGYGRMMERKTPPQGYVCYRCKIPGHFIQHCPTNGDPNYDIKRVKPPTGIPKSMLVATPDGSYALPSGAVAVLKPNEAIFEKEVEGLPSSRSVGELPPELHCPLCKEVMKDAVLTSRCCFKSYCDKCIRDYIISKSMCVCGKTNVLADYLLPNKTLRDTINRILENGTSSQENAGSVLQVQDMESAKCALPKVPSPSLSASAKDNNKVPSKSDVVDAKRNVDGEKPPASHTQHSSEKKLPSKSQEPAEPSPESVSTKEPRSQESIPVVEEEVQQKLTNADPARKKKKKRARQSFSNNDMQWRPNQDFGAEGCMMPYLPGAYNPYWPASQWGPESYLGACGNTVPYMGYGTSACVVPPDLYGAQGYMTGFIPAINREYMDYSVNARNSGLTVMSREEFEARKADLKRKREHEQRLHGKDHAKDSLDDEDAMEPSKTRPRIQKEALSHGNLQREDRGKNSEHHYRNHVTEDRGKSYERHHESLGNEEQARSSERHRENLAKEERGRSSEWHREIPAKEERGKSSERHRDLEYLPVSPRAQGKRKSEREESYGRDERRHRVEHISDSQAFTADAEMNKAGKSSTSGRPEKKQKPSVFERISYPEDRMDDYHMNAAKKRNLTSHESQNGFREHEGLTRHLNANKQHHDDCNGRRMMYEDDVSDKETSFKRKMSSSHRDRSHEKEVEKHPDSRSRTSRHPRDHSLNRRV
eukprot:TRINITY_DN2819_c0_g1_i2.p1 TRINITY_DN2819_c0_g1~~TRINITY_DN2819_c0_g1_i2.p1  ORF type:complete len:812 (-),score=188.43 TRINITY_DN2819_c0_g1_i2:132-2567(-)